MRKSVVIIILLWVFTLAWNLTGRVEATADGEHEQVQTSEICCTSYTLKCTDLGTGTQNVNLSPSFSVRNIQKGPSKFSVPALNSFYYTLNIRLYHPEWLDFNYKGQFCSSNLPFSICNLLI